ncbi:MAG: tRNA (guanine(37)-N(1))-methyltransferase [bacterium]|nr:tRNA (guanine(37)-N(1))-methyltransferase [bacterium]
MRFDILTIFPDIIYGYAEEAILGRAGKKNIIKVVAHDFRDWTLDKQRHVDDRPYGGGAGMVLQVEPIYRCLESLGLVKDGQKLGNKEIKKLGNQIKIQNSKFKIVVMDPAGKKFDQKMAQKFSKLDRLVIISGRYEGLDERIYKFADEKISVGDYVLAGGELPALSIVEAVSRLIPGVLGNEESLKEETFGNFKYPITNDKSMPKSKYQKSKLDIGNLPVRQAGLKLGFTVEYPQYTRPENFMGLRVPKVLLSGDHKKVAEWKKKHSK